MIDARGTGGTGEAHGHSPHIVGIVRRNIRALLEARQESERRMKLEERIAARVTDFAGSLRCVYAHAAFFGFWITANLGWIPGLRPWDPFPFVMLAMFASVEAIFLSTFVLIGQNRMTQMSERRAELDLHVNLLAEHEVTRLIEMVDAIACRLGVQCADDPETKELKKDVPPEAVLREIEHAEEESVAPPGEAGNSQHPDITKTEDAALRDIEHAEEHLLHQPGLPARQGGKLYNR